MKQQHSEKQLLSEIQLLLAEKRTYFSLFRTGLAVFTLPLTSIAFLAGTTQYHKFFENELVGAIVVVGLIVISLGGLSVFFNARQKIKRLNHLIKKIESGDERIDELIV